MIEKNSNEITVQTLRESMGLTQEALARKLNCSTRIIGDYDNRRRLPRIDSAASLAKELGVSLKTLFEAFGLDTAGIPDDRPPE
jgi:transcriptional regulator with XRE-family HTH domain